MVRVGGRSGVIYVVAEADSAQTLRIVKTKLEGFDTEVEDLGRVTGDLVRSLHLNPGDMIKTR